MKRIIYPIILLGCAVVGVQGEGQSVEKSGGDTNEVAIIAEADRHVRSLGRNELADRSKYSVVAEQGWFAFSTLNENARDYGLNVFLGTSGFVECFLNKRPGWAYSLGREITESDVADELEKLAERIFSPNSEYRWHSRFKVYRVLYSPRLSPSAKREAYLIYASEDFGFVFRRKSSVFEEGRTDSW